MSAEKPFSEESVPEESAPERRRTLVIPNVDDSAVAEILRRRSSQGRRASVELAATREPEKPSAPVQIAPRPQVKPVDIKAALGELGASKKKAVSTAPSEIVPAARVSVPARPTLNLSSEGLTRLQEMFPADVEAQVILKNLEKKGTNKFSEHTLELARLVLKDPNRNWLLSLITTPTAWLAEKTFSMLKPLLPVGGGVAGYSIGSEIGSAYVRERVMQRMLLELNPLQESVRGFLNGILAKLPSGAPGGMLDKIFGGLQSLGQASRDSVVEGAQAAIEKGAAGVAASAASAASVPAGVLGYMAGGAATGALVGVAEEYSRANSFAGTAALIERSEGLTKVLADASKSKRERVLALARGYEATGFDPRDEIEVEHDRLLARARKGDIPSFTPKEWLTFLSAAYRARASNLRERLQAHDEKLDKAIPMAPERLRELSAKMIAGEQQLTELEQRLISEILTFATKDRENDLMPIAERNAKQDAILTTVGRYTKAMAVGAINGAFLPLRVAGKVVSGVAGAAISVWDLLTGRTAFNVAREGVKKLTQ